MGSPRPSPPLAAILETRFKTATNHEGKKRKKQWISIDLIFIADF